MGAVFPPVDTTASHKYSFSVQSASHSTSKQQYSNGPLISGTINPFPTSSEITFYSGIYHSVSPLSTTASDLLSLCVASATSRKLPDHQQPQPALLLSFQRCISQPDILTLPFYSFSFISFALSIYTVDPSSLCPYMYLEDI